MPDENLVDSSTAAEIYSEIPNAVVFEDPAGQVGIIEAPNPMMSRMIYESLRTGDQQVMASTWQGVMGPGSGTSLPWNVTNEVGLPMRYGNLVVNPLAIAVLERDRLRASLRVAARDFYRLYHYRLRVLQGYRQASPDFDRLCFRDLLRSCITESKVVVTRPGKLDDEDEYQALQARLGTPFRWFNEQVNASLAGKVGGIQEVLYWLLHHLLEGGLGGWLVTMSTVDINGVKWRVPMTMMTFGGERLACDQDASSFEDEHWFVKLRDDEPMGSSPSYNDASRYYRLRNRPDQWIYGDVVKFEHPAGSGTYYPTPPYFAGMDALLAEDMMLRDDLSALHNRERALVIWKFDIEAMKRAGVRWKDVTVDGVTSPGAFTLFKMERQRMLATRDFSGGTEMFTQSFVTWELHTPDTQLLTQVQKSQPYRQRIHMMAGILYDPEGKEMEEQSRMRGEIDFAFVRTQILQPCINAVYRIIADENARYFGTLNGLGSDYNPFLWQSKQFKRKPRASDDLELAERQRRARLDLAMDGHCVNVAVRFQLTPSASRNNDYLTTSVRAWSSGAISSETLGERMGIDPDVERGRMAYEKSRLYVPQEVEGLPIFSAPSTFAQSYQVGDQIGIHRSPVSPGRPAGVPEDGPRDLTADGG